MGKMKFNGFKQLLGTLATTAAVMVTAINVNSACVYIVHQKKLPNSAAKLRKF